KYPGFRGRKDDADHSNRYAVGHPESDPDSHCLEPDSVLLAEPDPLVVADPDEVVFVAHAVVDSHLDPAEPLADSEVHEHTAPVGHPYAVALTKPWSPK